MVPTKSIATRSGAWRSPSTTSGGIILRDAHRRRLEGVPRIAKGVPAPKSETRKCGQFLVEGNCDESRLDSEIPATVASGERAEYRAESKVALPRAGTGGDLVCMASLLARNHGKRLVVSRITDELGHHGESVNGACDDCFEEGWLRDLSPCGRCARTTPRQVRGEPLRSGSSTAARSAAWKTWIAASRQETGWKLE